MRRRRIDMDWYVDMSERLERRDARRKWVFLAVAVSLALLLLFGGTAVLWINKYRPAWFRSAFGWLGIRPSSSAPARKPSRRKVLERIVVDHFENDDLRYPQLDPNGFPTTVTHYFREFPLDLPSTAKGEDTRRGFRVSRSDESSGKIDTYRLRNIGTGEQFLFSDVACKRVSGSEWVITDEGHRKIHRVLQAKMKVPLSKALRGPTTGQ